MEQVTKNKFNIGDRVRSISKISQSGIGWIVSIMTPNSYLGPMIYAHVHQIIEVWDINIPNWRTRPVYHVALAMPTRSVKGIPQSVVNRMVYSEEELEGLALGYDWTEEVEQRLNKNGSNNQGEIHGV